MKTMTLSKDFFKWAAEQAFALRQPEAPISQRGGLTGIPENPYQAAQGLPESYKAKLIGDRFGNIFAMAPKATVSPPGTLSNIWNTVTGGKSEPTISPEEGVNVARWSAKNNRWDPTPGNSIPNIGRNDTVDLDTIRAAGGTHYIPESGRAFGAPTQPGAGADLQTQIADIDKQLGDTELHPYFSDSRQQLAQKAMDLEKQLRAHTGEISNVAYKAQSGGVEPVTNADKFKTRLADPDYASGLWRMYAEGGGVQPPPEVVSAVAEHATQDPQYLHNFVQSIVQGREMKNTPLGQPVQTSANVGSEGDFLNSLFQMAKKLPQESKGFETPTYETDKKTLDDLAAGNRWGEFNNHVATMAQRYGPDVWDNVATEYEPQYNQQAIERGMHFSPFPSEPQRGMSYSSSDQMPTGLEAAYHRGADLPMLKNWQKYRDVHAPRTFIPSDYNAIGQAALKKRLGNKPPWPPMNEQQWFDKILGSKS